jgi:hypothetical protein
MTRREEDRASSAWAGVPCVRGTAFFGVKAALVEHWGEAGLREVKDRVPPEVRAAVFDSLLTPQDWLPEAHLIETCLAAWRGPARERDLGFRAFLASSVYQGFGRFQKVLLHIASLRQVVERAPALWRRDHTHGALTFDLADRVATVRLVDHPYADDDFAARVFADTLRGLFLLSRATGGQIRERHARTAPRALVVELSWGLPSSRPPEAR